MSDFKFQWDQANINHLADHGITPSEAEQVFSRFFVERVTDLVDGEECYQALGQTDKGRYLLIAFTERGEYIRPITGWDMKLEEYAEYVQRLIERLAFPE